MSGSSYEPTSECPGPRRNWVGSPAFEEQDFDGRSTMRASEPRPPSTRADTGVPNHAARRFTAVRAPPRKRRHNPWCPGRRRRMLAARARRHRLEHHERGVALLSGFAHHDRVVGVAERRRPARQRARCTPATRALTVSAQYSPPRTARSSTECRHRHADAPAATAITARLKLRDADEDQPERVMDPRVATQRQAPPHASPRISAV